MLGPRSRPLPVTTVCNKVLSVINASRLRLTVVYTYINIYRAVAGFRGGMGNRVEYVVDGYCVGDCRSIVELTADTARSPTPLWLLLTNVLLCSKLVPALVRVLPLRFPMIMRTRTTRTNSYELCGRRAPLPEFEPELVPRPSYRQNSYQHWCEFFHYDSRG